MSPDEDLNYSDSEELAIDEQEEHADYVDDYNEDLRYGDHPAQKHKETIFSVFWKIIGLKDSTKVGNIDKFEIGRLDLSVRNCEYISLVGDVLNNDAVKNFYRSKGEIILATSLSKRGFFLDTMITQKRISLRGSSQNPTAQSEQPKQGGGFLGFGKPKPQGGQQ